MAADDPRFLVRQILRADASVGNEVRDGFGGFLRADTDVA
jgi:hypothetical protein